jgi:ATP-dependent DNA ligase
MRRKIKSKASGSDPAHPPTWIKSQLTRRVDEPPPRDSRFGSPLKLSRVHLVRPEVVVEVTYLTWTEDNLLRQVSYQGQREDKPAKVVRPVAHPPRRSR